MSEARPFASQTGKSPSEKKRVTLRDVAEEAGVSLKTASNVINHTGRMTDATREKVQKVVDRLGYRVNVSARNLNRGRTGFITLAVPCLTAPYLAELANRVIDAARIYGYSVYVTTYAEGTSHGVTSLLRNFNSTFGRHDPVTVRNGGPYPRRLVGGLSAGMRGRAFHAL